jgi:hypothetical protein
MYYRFGVDATTNMIRINGVNYPIPTGTGIWYRYVGGALSAGTNTLTIFSSDPDRDGNLDDFDISEMVLIYGQP